MTILIPDTFSEIEEHFVEDVSCESPGCSREVEWKAIFPCCTNTRLVCGPCYKEWVEYLQPQIPGELFYHKECGARYVGPPRFVRV